MAEPRKELAAKLSKSVGGAKRASFAALVLVPLLFSGALLLILYAVSNWPSPPGIGWASSWTPDRFFLAGAGLVAVFLMTSFLLFWRLSSRWLWTSASSVLDVLEGGQERGAQASGAPGDVEYLAYRIQKALERQKSAGERAEQLRSVVEDARRLSDAVRRMSELRFDESLPAGEEALEPLRSALEEFRADMASFLSGCAEIASQIARTVRRAGERTAALASQAEKSFVAHSEVSLAARKFVKAVQDALASASRERKGELRFERGTSAEAGRRLTEAVGECGEALGEVKHQEGTGKAIAEDSRKLADEATVVALNAAIEASRTESSSLEALAESARGLAESSMDLAQRVDALGRGYAEAVERTSKALDELRMRFLEWREQMSALDAERADAAASIESFMSSVLEMAAELASRVEGVSRAMESASSEGETARKAMEEALADVEALRRRLGAGA